MVREYLNDVSSFFPIQPFQKILTLYLPSVQCIGSSRNPISGTNLVDDSRNMVRWTCAGCIFNYSSDHSYTIATSRGATYDGPTWSLNGKLSVGLPNTAQVWVQLGGQVNSAWIKLTAKKSSASTVEYKTVEEGIAYAGCWTQLSGTYTLDGPSDQVAVYVEGPDPGVDEWVASPAVFLPGSYGVPVPKVPQTNVVSAPYFSTASKCVSWRSEIKFPCECAGSGRLPEQ
jgi:hypothetical protein